jgi:superfamily II DNA/RNA helicase
MARQAVILAPTREIAMQAPRVSVEFEQQALNNSDINGHYLS